MKKFALMGALLLLSSCTYNIIMTHTEGTATDIVDSDPRSESETDIPLEAKLF